MPTFDGSEGKQISTATGTGYTHRFQTNYPNEYALKLRQRIYLLFYD